MTLDSIPTYKAPRGGKLSAEMLADYRAAGVLILEDFVPVEACKRLRERALQLVEAFDPETVRRYLAREAREPMERHETGQYRLLQRIVDRVAGLLRERGHRVGLR